MSGFNHDDNLKENTCQKKKSGGGRGLTADSISAPWQSEPSAVCKVFKSKMFSNLVLTFSSMDPTVVGHITTTADDHKV